MATRSRSRRRAFATTIPGGPSGYASRGRVTQPEIFDTSPQTIVHGFYGTPTRRTARGRTASTGISPIQTIAVGAGVALGVYLLAKIIAP